jgi:hypothetical protein
MSRNLCTVIAAPCYRPDDSVNEPLLAVLGCVRSIDVQGLEHCVGQALRLQVLLHNNMACVHTPQHSTAQHSTPVSTKAGFILYLSYQDNLKAQHGDCRTHASLPALTAGG